MTLNDYDAFEVFEHGAHNYSVTLINTKTGARFRTNPVACGRQARSQVTRCGERPMRFLGVFKRENGQTVETSFPDDCDLRDPLHVHVHRFPLPTREVRSS